MVERTLMVRLVVGSILHVIPIELFPVPVSVTVRDGAHKRSLAANRKE